jgi:hypothetical protein
VIRRGECELASSAHSFGVCGATTFEFPEVWQLNSRYPYVLIRLKKLTASESVVCVVLALSRNFSFDWLCVAINTGGSSFLDQGIAMKISLFAAVTIALVTSTGLQTCEGMLL